MNNINCMNPKLKKLIDNYCNNWSAKQITGSGSNRVYYRITFPKGSCIAVYSSNSKETKAFLNFTQTFDEAGANVPKIIAADETDNIYLLEDLGNIALFDLITTKKNNTLNDYLTELCRKSLKCLANIQFEASKNINYSLAFPTPTFDKMSIMWDLNYFKYNFLKVINVDFDELALEKDFNFIADKALAANTNSFMYRDFQSRNIIIRNNEPWFIDYQGGRKGPCTYDLVSFIYQAKAGFIDDDRSVLKNDYYNFISQYIDYDKKHFDNDVLIMRLLRILQTLGAYGFRGLIERKPHFYESISISLENTYSLLQELDVDSFKLPELRNVFSSIKAKKNLGNNNNNIVPDKLNLIVTSFSYLYNSVPSDHSHGGGFVFDCRALPNPYWIPELRQFCGKDLPIINFLENEKEVYDFLDYAVNITEISVKKYIQRNFNMLQVSFGCSGGKHRSVYCAEKFAEYYQKKYKNINVIINHLREDTW